MDNPIITQDRQMTTIWDQWLIVQDKAILEIKAWIKKVADSEKNKVEKEDKACKKTQSKN